MFGRLDLVGAASLADLLSHIRLASGVHFLSPCVFISGASAKAMAALIESRGADIDCFRPSLEPTDDELVGRVLTHDVAAFGQLYDRHIQAVYTLAVHLLGPSEA